ncbi:DUF6082 family protein [Streptomyces ossamyceticus]|nr:DUF6082 family protein [Streptomyces ossamyceticus]
MSMRRPPAVQGVGPVTQRSQTARAAGKVLAVLAASTAVLGVVFLSPFALKAFGNGKGEEWSRLSAIGQTYGATSAIVSAFALGGVAVSLFLQARQARADQIQGIRGFHTELIRMQLDDLPLYLPCWGPLDLPDDDARRQHIYTNLMVQYAWMGYEIGTIPEPLLRNMLGGMFQGHVGRRFWPMARDAWIAGAGGTRRGRRFLTVIDDEYAKAVAARPPVVHGAPEPDASAGPSGDG